MTVLDIETAAMTLPVDDRERLAHRLLDSLQSDTTAFSEDWAAEIGRRLDAIDAGLETTLSEAEFQESIRPIREMIQNADR